MLLSISDWIDLKKRVRKDLIPHLFISYAREDRVFVEQMAKDLQAEGLQVWLDLWEMRVGDSIIQKINQGIEESDYLVIVLSPDSLRSRWIQEELSAGIMQLLDEQDVRILPVLLRDCKIPALLRHRFYADFRHDYSLGFETLVSLLQPVLIYKDLERDIPRLRVALRRLISKVADMGDRDLERSRLFNEAELLQMNLRRAEKVGDSEELLAERRKLVQTVNDVTFRYLGLTLADLAP